MRTSGLWKTLVCSPPELRLEYTLTNGQCFNWHRQPGDDPVWVGMLGRRLLALRETDAGAQYRCITEMPSATGGASVADELRDYFQLATPLAPLYESWSAADARMTTCASVLPGMRVLRQDPVECLFSFVCSSNNNIGRIGGMLMALRRQYGVPVPPPPADEPPIYVHAMGSGGVGEATREFFAFPTTAALAAASEGDLRALGLGYRATFVRLTAQALCDRGESWLPGLRAVVDPVSVRASLCDLLYIASLSALASYRCAPRCASFTASGPRWPTVWRSSAWTRPARSRSTRTCGRSRAATSTRRCASAPR